MKKIGLILSIILAAGLVFMGCQNPPEEVTVTFHANGGQFGTGAVTTVTVVKGSTLTADQIPAVTWTDGRQFSGFNSAMNGSGTALVAGTTAIEADITYYARWESVTITFNAGDGAFTGGAGSGTSTRNVTINKGATVVIPTDVGLDGFDLVEWNTAANGSGTTLEATTTHDANTTYHAIWEEEASVTVLYDMQDDAWVLGLDGVGSRNHDNGWVRTSYESGTLGVVTTGPVTLHVDPRGGSSQGFRISVTQMIEKNIIKAGFSYKIEYAGLLPTADRGRLRVESGVNLPIGAGIPGKPTADNVLQITASNAGSFNMVMVLSYEELVAMRTAGNTGNGTEISFGTSGNVPLTYTHIKISEIPTPTVIYDLATDPDIAELAGTGGTREEHFIRGNGAGTTELTVDEVAKTLKSTGRTGSSQGVRFSTTLFAPYTTPGQSYVIEYWGILHNLTDTTGTANQGRLRLESGTNPPAGTGIPAMTAAGNVLALSAGVSPAVDASAAFNLSWTVTAEELAAMNGVMSLGDVRHTGSPPSGDRLYDITYTKIKITEIP